MASIFSKIVKGEIPSFKIAETADYFAFLDVNPLHEGHTLVIPKKEVDYIFDLDTDTYVGLMSFAKDVAKAIESVMPCARIGVAVIGLEVAHAHVHLVPIDKVSDIDFSKPKLSLEPSEMKSIANRIKQAYKRAQA